MLSKLGKISGALGVLLGVGASAYHMIDPSAIPEKYVPLYVGIGTILALFGKHPLKK